MEQFYIFQKGAEAETEAAAIFRARNAEHALELFAATNPEDGLWYPDGPANKPAPRFIAADWSVKTDADVEERPAPDVESVAKAVGQQLSKGGVPPQGRIQGAGRYYLKRDDDG